LGGNLHLFFLISFLEPISIFALTECKESENEPIIVQDNIEFLYNLPYSYN